MTDYPTLNNAPIVEAVFDIRVKFEEEVDLEQLEAIHQAVADRFPEKTERMVAQVTFGPNVPKPSHTQEITGYLFKSNEQKKLFQVRLDGFTFNKLKPYETWSDFRDEAIELWKLFTEMAKPRVATRIALRFINRIEIPGVQAKIEDYFTTYPQISEKLPQGIADYLMRLVIPNPQNAALGILTQKMEQPTPDGHLPVIFDIDCFYDREYEVSGSALLDDFENLRNYKNQLFFDSLTEKALELFI